MDELTITGQGGVKMSVKQLLMCIIPYIQSPNVACTVGNFSAGKGPWVLVRNFTPSCPGYMDALRKLPRAISLMMGEKPDYMTYAVLEQQLEGLCDAVGSPYTALICQKFSILVHVDQRMTSQDCPE
jgi:hypothetical protein